MRASPVAPFVATSYLLGLSRVPFRDYLLGTLASLPALLGYVMVGALAARGVISTVAQNWMGSASLIIGVVATALLTAKIGGLIANALKISVERPVTPDGLAISQTYGAAFPQKVHEGHFVKDAAQNDDSHGQ